MNNNLTINKLQIENLTLNSLNGIYEGVTHKKILSVLSIVQPLDGSYEISINNGEKFIANAMDVFIAPSSVMQELIHHDGKLGKMKSHWAFIDATVNDIYKFDEIFSFPVILNKKYNEQVYNLISTALNSVNAFEKMRCGYSLLEILYNESEKKQPTNSINTQIEIFVKNNYFLDIKAKDIAKNLFCSVPQVFRYTNKYYGVSPSNYVNGIRLQQAEIQLRYTLKSITEIAISVGFSDVSYFSKLFKRHYGDNPINYRKKYSINN